MGLSLVTPLLLLSIAGADSSPRRVRFAEIPKALQPRLAATEFEFDALLDHIDRDTAARLEVGEHEQLVFFVLQSNSFTSRPPIEPAAAARDTASQGYKPSFFTRARMREFLTALDQPVQDARLAHWQTALARDQRSLPLLETWFAETMQQLGTPAKWTSRSHSTDATMQTAFQIWSALGKLANSAPDLRIENVLVIGPGQDFAPATAFHDNVPPQSFEPFLAADALLQWKLTDEGYMSITCFDINQRVLQFLQEFKRSASPKLTLPVEQGEKAFNEWFDSAGRGIGIASSDAYRKTIVVRPTVAKRVNGELLNVLTHRLVPNPEYDLVVMLNVMQYFNSKEVALALANIESMLRPRGYLLHNDPRPEIAELAEILSMAMLQPPAGLQLLTKR